jgi:hypothetical protein
LVERAFFFVIHGTREVVHFNVTRHPREAWVTQQLRDATRMTITRDI